MARGSGQTTRSGVEALPSGTRHKRSRDDAAADAVLAEFDFLRDSAVEAADAGRTKRAKALAERLEARAWELIDQAAPVRLSYAARLVGIREQSLRPWVERGALEVVEGSRPQRLTFGSVVEVREIVEELREVGEDRNVLRAAMARIEGEALSGNSRFQESLAQMHRGERGALPY